MGLELHKRLPDGGAVFIQTLQPIAESERAAYLSATYGKRAHLFFIQERRPLSPAQIRAMDARDLADIGPQSVRAPSAASLILGKLASKASA